MVCVISSHKSLQQTHPKIKYDEDCVIKRNHLTENRYCTVQSIFWNQYIFGLDNESDLALFALDEQKFPITSIILHPHKNIDYQKNQPLQLLSLKVCSLS